MTRSKKVSEETEKATTLAILKNVPSPNKTVPEEAKENKKQSPLLNAPLKPDVQQPTETEKNMTMNSDARYNIFPRERSSPMPCAQYKTDKGYRCSNCHRCYNARKNLVRHVTLECGVEPRYKCPYCSYSKHRRNELKKHIEKKHPERVEKKLPDEDVVSSPVAAK